jgi:PAS domain S-box-containing protein
MHNPHQLDTNPIEQHKVAELEKQLDRLLKENLRLQERMEWLSVFFERAPVGFILESKGGWVIESNAKTQQILGYSAEELRGMAFTEFSHPDDLGNELELFEKLVTGEYRSYSNKKRYIRKDGTVIHGHVHVSFLQEPRSVLQPVVIGIIEQIEDTE